MESWKPIACCRKVRNLHARDDGSGLWMPMAVAPLSTRSKISQNGTCDSGLSIKNELLCDVFRGRSLSNNDRRGKSLSAEKVGRKQHE